MRAGLAALKGERGFAVPTVMTVMVIGLGFSAAAVTVAANSQNGTNRDQNRKAALVIADAGAQRALFAYNKITTGPLAPCVVKTGSGSGATLTAQRGPASSTVSPPWFCNQVGGSGDPDAAVGIAGGHFTYWVNPCVGQQLPNGYCAVTAATREIKIVSEGTQGGVTRRVAMTATGKPGSLATGNAKAIGLDGITMEGWSEMEVPAATNKSFVMKKQGGCPGNKVVTKNPIGLDDNDGCPRVCPGDWRYPVEVSVGPAPNDFVEAPGTQRCTPGRVNPPGPPESDATVVNRTISLAPVDVTSARAVNDDGRLGNCTIDWTNRAAYDAAVAWNAAHANDIPRDPAYPKPVPVAQYAQSGCTLTGGLSKDSVSGPGTVTWDATTKTLTMNGTGDAAHRLELDLGGRNYYFCRIVLTGTSYLATAATTPIAGTDNVASKLYFDSPQNCPGNPSQQISVTGDSNIGSASWNPFAANPGVLPLVAMAGSKTRATQAYFQTNTWYFSNKMMLYAPLTDIVLNTWARENEGWFAGKTIAMKQGAEIESPPTLDPVGVGIVPSDYINFQQKAYVECGGPGSTLDANC